MWTGLSICCCVGVWWQMVWWHGGGRTVQHARPLRRVGGYTCVYTLLHIGHPAYASSMQARFADLCEFNFDSRSWARVKTSLGVCLYALPVLVVVGSYLFRWGAIFYTPMGHSSCFIFTQRYPRIPTTTCGLAPTPSPNPCKCGLAASYTPGPRLGS